MYAAAVFDPEIDEKLPASLRYAEYVQTALVVANTIVNCCFPAGIVMHAGIFQSVCNGIGPACMPGVISDYPLGQAKCRFHT